MQSLQGCRRVAAEQHGRSTRQGHTRVFEVVVYLAVQSSLAVTRTSSANATSQSRCCGPAAPAVALRPPCRLLLKALVVPQNVLGSCSESCRAGRACLGCKVGVRGARRGPCGRPRLMRYSGYPVPTAACAWDAPISQTSIYTAADLTHCPFHMLPGDTVRSKIFRV